MSKVLYGIGNDGTDARWKMHVVLGRCFHLRLRLNPHSRHISSSKKSPPHWLYIPIRHNTIAYTHCTSSQSLTSTQSSPTNRRLNTQTHTQPTHHNAPNNHPTSNSDSPLQLPRLVKPTAPAPPHRRNSLLRQNSPNLLPHKLRAAIDRLRRPQALDPLLRLETQQHRRERARNRQLRRERRNLAAMGGRRWQQSGGGAGGGFHERAGGRGWWRGE